jgi:hypothetical protein
VSVSVSGRPVSTLAGGRTGAPLGDLFDQLFDTGEQFLFGARVVGEA